jgi:hypothetical protein
VGVTGVGAGDAVAEVALDPGQRGVPQPVGGDALGGDPRQLLAEAVPKVVVATAGDRDALAEPQQRIGGQDRTTAPGVLGQRAGQVEGDRLLALGTALLAQTNQAARGVEIHQPQPERATAAARRLGV